MRPWRRSNSATKEDTDKRRRTPLIMERFLETVSSVEEYRIRALRGRAFARRGDSCRTPGSTSEKPAKISPVVSSSAAGTQLLRGVTAPASEKLTSSLATAEL